MEEYNIAIIIEFIFHEVQHVSITLNFKEQGKVQVFLEVYCIDSTYKINYFNEYA